MTLKELVGLGFVRRVGRWFRSQRRVGPWIRRSVAPAAFYEGQAMVRVIARAGSAARPETSPVRLAHRLGVLTRTTDVI